MGRCSWPPGCPQQLSLDGGELCYYHHKVATGLIRPDEWGLWAASVLPTPENRTSLAARLAAFPEVAGAVASWAPERSYARRGVGYIPQGTVAL